MRRTLLAMLLLVSATLAFGQKTKVNGVVIDQTAQRIVDAISANIEKESPLRMDFVMTTKNKGKQIDSQKGTFLSHGAKFRLLSTDYEDYSDGKNLWHFVKANQEVELTSLDSESNVFNIINMIKSYSKDYRPKLIREENRGNAVFNVIDLVPKGKSAIAKIRIVANKNSNRISEMSIQIREGNTYIYTISKYETKVKTQDNDFVFPSNKYPNIEIIDLR
jgi:outer membrane lipoprotein-sorting protein